MTYLAPWSSEKLIKRVGCDGSGSESCCPLDSAMAANPVLESDASKVSKTVLCTTQHHWW